jgi:hypothetical protein
MVWVAQVDITFSIDQMLLAFRDSKRKDSGYLHWDEKYESASGRRLVKNNRLRYFTIFAISSFNHIFKGNTRY